MAREAFHPDVADISLDMVLGAPSGPIRCGVLRCITGEEPLYCGDLIYNVIKSTLSHHLRTLWLSGLMCTEVLGKQRHVTRRDRAIEQCFPDLLEAVELPPGKGHQEEQEIVRPSVVR